MFRHSFVQSQFLFITSLFLLVAIAAAMPAAPGLLKADGPVLSSAATATTSATAATAVTATASASRLPAFSSEELARKGLTDTGWPCGETGRHCTHILINDDARLHCVPAETRDGVLLIPLEHFRYIGGCGMETGPDGKLGLIYYDQLYRMEAGSPYLLSGDKSWTMPVEPISSHGFLYVPLRFLCETLGLEIRWDGGSNVVLLHSPWVDAESLPVAFAALNARLLAAISESGLPGSLEPIELPVTFYFSNKNPAYTASGHIAAPGSMAADSSIPFGTQYYIPILACIREDAVFTVHDRGGGVKGNLLDVYVPESLRGDPEVEALLRMGLFKTTVYLLPDAD